MNWQEKYERHVAGFPNDVREAHGHSSKHRIEVEISSYCGCFYCTAIFTPEKIADWVDEDSTGVGQTALCPCCGIDSVIADSSGFPITEEFLSRMRSYWF